MANRSVPSTSFHVERPERHTARGHFDRAIPLLKRLGSRKAPAVALLATAAVALLGLFLPTWAYLAFRSPVAELLDQSVGFGPGFWLNGIGHLIVAVVAVSQLSGLRQQ